jgi:hypothetical protein
MISESQSSSSIHRWTNSLSLGFKETVADRTIVAIVASHGQRLTRPLNKDGRQFGGELCVSSIHRPLVHMLDELLGPKHQTPSRRQRDSCAGHDGTSKDC